MPRNHILTPLDNMMGRLFAPGSRLAFLPLFYSLCALASPAPEVTPLPTKVQPAKRDLSSWALSVAQGLPTDVASGILPAFQGLPDSDQVQDQLDIGDQDVDNLPLSVLNIPSVIRVWNDTGTSNI